MSPNKTIWLSQSGYQIYQKYQIQVQFHLFSFYIIYACHYLVLKVKEIAFPSVFSNVYLWWRNQQT